MKHDDDEANGFHGVTFITHGSDHTTKGVIPDEEDIEGDKSVDESDNNDSITEAESKPPKQRKHREPDKISRHGSRELEEIKHLEARLAQLEARLANYEEETGERFKHLEWLAGHPLSPAERVYRIQEDS